MIKIIKTKGGLYTICTKFEVNTNLSQTWDFFTNVKNVSRIMPKELNFKVTSKTSKKFYEGEIIKYKNTISNKYLYQLFY